MSDIVEFLRARLDEDEAVARAACRGHEGSARWKLESPNHSFGVYDAVGDPVTFDQEGLSDSVASVEVGEHIARYDPDRVLREVEAKRRIMEGHSHCEDVSYGDASTCPEMRTLAAIYADHPDYDPAWRS